MVIVKNVFSLRRKTNLLGIVPTYAIPTLLFTYIHHLKAVRQVIIWMWPTKAIQVKIPLLRSPKHSNRPFSPVTDIPDLRLSVASGLQLYVAKFFI